MLLFTGLRSLESILLFTSTAEAELLPQLTLFTSISLPASCDGGDLNASGLHARRPDRTFYRPDAGKINIAVRVFRDPGENTTTVQLRITNIVHNTIKPLGARLQQKPKQKLRGAAPPTEGELPTKEAETPPPGPHHITSPLRAPWIGARSGEMPRYSTAPTFVSIGTVSGFVALDVA